MRTENDLRDAIHARADLAPAFDPIAVRAPAERHRRRSMTIATAVVATAAVAGGVVVAASTLGGGSHPQVGGATKTDRPSASASTTLPATPPPSLIDSSMRIRYGGAGVEDTFQTAQAQYLELRAPGFRSREITAYTPGLFDKSLIEHPQPVTVNGVPGYFGGALPWRNDDVSHTDPAQTDPRGSKYGSTTPTLAWQVGTRWISVSSDVPGEGTLAALKAIAAEVRTSEDPVRTPIRLGYLPAGYRLADVDHSKAPGRDGQPTALVGLRRNDKYDYWDWDVNVARTPKRSGNGGGLPVAHPINPEVSRRVGNYTVTVETLGAISKAEAKKVLASVTIADDPATPNDSWFDVAQALP